ncbi:hypothetical protein V5O48_010345 [Marasmius crinis-equi]|uniref:F-box domain-containing protein n=1 Tax=Marasmius crinis-equi TaxID=585013 RepID=A0ABR3F8P7_9AGAR
MASHSILPGNNSPLPVSMSPSHDNGVALGGIAVCALHRCSIDHSVDVDTITSRTYHNRMLLALQLPFLVWEIIFQDLEIADMSALALSCEVGFFELLASTKLYEVIDWRNPAVTNANLTLWACVPPIFPPPDITRQLAPGNLFWYHSSFAEITKTLIIRDDDKGGPGVDRDFCAMFRVMSFMRNLKHLIIQNTIFPILDFFKVSEGLPSLKKLTIIDVVFDFNVYGVLPPVHRRLFKNPISLFIRGNYRLQLQQSEFGIVAIIRLFSSPAIVRLDVDMYVLFAVYTFLRDRAEDLWPWQVWLTWERRSLLLRNLKHLTFTVFPDLELRDDVIIGPHERSAARQLIEFVRNLYPDLRSLTVRGSVPLSKDGYTPRQSLLFLNRFTGPLHLANHYLGEGNHLHTLTVLSWITDSDRLVVELRGCPPSRATRSLHIPMIYPTTDIFPILHKSFPFLEKLYLKFGFKLLCKDDIMGAISSALAKFTRLEVLHLTTDTLQPDFPESDLPSIADHLGRQCSGLTELRLYFDRVIVRTGSDEWHF